MLLRRVIEHVKTQNWTAVGIDFVIVVVGVFIGVQVNELVADGVNRQREHAYLLALKNDFAIIQAELEQDAAEYAAVADAMTFLLDQSRMARPDATPDELNVAVAALILMEGTPIVSGTFDAITGSGDLEIIRSDKVKVALTAFFGRAEVIRLVALTHESQLVNIFQPYIIAHLDYPRCWTGLEA